MHIPALASLGKIPGTGLAIKVPENLLRRCIVDRRIGILIENIFNIVDGDDSPVISVTTRTITRS